MRLDIYQNRQVIRRGMGFTLLYGQGTMQHVVKINDPGIRNTVQDHLIRRSTCRYRKCFPPFQHGKVCYYMTFPAAARNSANEQQTQQGDFKLTFHETKIIRWKGF